MVEAKAVDPKRSAMMARIGQRNTKPELSVRRVLHRMGYRFRLHRKDLPGTPDIVLPRHHAAVLVHGCFWHRHPRCRFAYTPKTRFDFWSRKFQQNVERDQRTERALRRQGWAVLTVWECETRDIPKLSDKLARKLGRLDK
jgi:DNA mismatch endonuclease (patch repair protein)